MAIFQLGAIVTAIKGSIGGTAFKTQRGSNVMYRKSNGFSRSRQLINKALVYSRWIFTNWPYLTNEQKEAWANLASTVLFPDKFGNQVHITGRQLYTKVNLNLQQNDYYASVPEGFSMLVPLVTLSDAFFDSVAGTAGLTADIQDGLECYLFVSAQVSKNPLSQPIFIRRYTLTSGVKSGTVNLEFGAEFFSQFPYVDSSYNVRYYVDIVNIYGIKGTPLYIDAGAPAPPALFTPNPYVISSQWGVGFNITTELPEGTIFRVSAQYSAGAYPEPDFDAATFVAERTLTVGNTISMSFLLNANPFALINGNYVRLWVQADLGGGVWSDAQNIIASEIPAVSFNFITGAVFQVTPDGGTLVEYDVYCKRVDVDGVAGALMEAFVYFDYWNVGDPVPDQTQTFANITGIGDIDMPHIVPFIEWDASNKRQVYRVDNVTAPAVFAIIVNTQEVPTIP